MLNLYYCTIVGFATFVEKNFLSFGHPFHTCYVLEGSRLHEFLQLIWDYKTIIVLCRMGYSHQPHLTFSSHLSLFACY